MDNIIHFLKVTRRGLFFTLGSRPISLEQSKSAIESEVENKLRGSYGNVGLENADENICLLVLKTLAKLQNSGQLRENHCMFLGFSACCFDERFFAFLF